MRDVREPSGHAVLVPADALIYDRVFEAVFVVIEAGGTGFHFDEDDFLDVLRVHAFENEKVDRRPRNFASVGLKGKLVPYQPNLVTLRTDLVKRVQERCRIP